jgi:hypothetical protein
MKQCMHNSRRQAERAFAYNVVSRPLRVRFFTRAHAAARSRAYLIYECELFACRLSVSILSQRSFS